MPGSGDRVLHPEYLRATASWDTTHGLEECVGPYWSLALGSVNFSHGIARLG